VLAVAAFIRSLSLRRVAWGYCCLAFGWPAALAVVTSLRRPEAMVGVVGAQQLLAGAHSQLRPNLNTACEVF